MTILACIRVESLPIPVSYMGTKRQLAPLVAERVGALPEGSFLDLFAGMCSVGAAVSAQRQVWSNDLQVFAKSVAEAHFCFEACPPLRMDVAASFRKRFTQLRDERHRVAVANLAAEQAALASNDANVLGELYSYWTSEHLGAGGLAYTIFERNFAGAFFGLSQSIEIDVIRQVLDDAKKQGQLSSEAHAWLILALAVAVGQCATATGHFAQPLRPNQRSLKRFANQRSKDIFSHWLRAIDQLAPYGSPEWRKKNRSFRSDAVDLIASFAADGSEVPAVVYADPPYTSDHYSRFYHVYETLLLYDYPGAVGRGRYREDRAVSKFSIKTEVEEALRGLIQGTARIGASLILSYPTNGLLAGSREIVPQMMRESYGQAPDILEVAHRHSTMGASKGPGKTDVTEVLYVARAA